MIVLSYQGEDLLKFCSPPVLDKINSILKKIEMSVTADINNMVLLYNPLNDFCLIKILVPSYKSNIVIGCFKLGSDKFHPNPFPEESVVEK